MIACNTHFWKISGIKNQLNSSRYISQLYSVRGSRDISKLGIECGFQENHPAVHLWKFAMNLDGTKRFSRHSGLKFAFPIPLSVISKRDENHFCPDEEPLLHRIRASAATSTISGVWPEPLATKPCHQRQSLPINRIKSPNQGYVP